MTDQRLLRKWPTMMAKKYTRAKGNPDFQILPVCEDSLESFYILLKPTGGHYRGQTHVLEFKTKWGQPPDAHLFPFNPPLVKFITKIFHPNVSTNGSICVDILTDSNKWSPQYDINAVMSSIILLMDVPNNASPFNCQASDLYVKCERNYKKQTTGQSIPHDALQKIFEECFDIFGTTSRIHATCNISKYLEMFASSQREADLVDQTDKMSLTTNKTK
jgi:ubiquitin-protein ligase